MTIKNSKFLKRMEEEGLKGIQLEKGNGYFYIWSDINKWINIINNIYDNSFLLNSFKDQSIDDWIYDIKKKIKEAEND